VGLQGHKTLESQSFSIISGDLPRISLLGVGGIVSVRGENIFEIKSLNTNLPILILTREVNGPVLMLVDLWRSGEELGKR